MRRIGILILVLVIFSLSINAVNTVKVFKSECRTCLDEQAQDCATQAMAAGNAARDLLLSLGGTPAQAQAAFLDEAQNYVWVNCRECHLIFY